ncbi:MAG: hypothetical protein II948_03155 [Synergistaceae bacterium]|nr:hypothetical protein [Synergistaceae bacterium]
MEFLTANQAAKKLGMTCHDVLMLTKRGILPQGIQQDKKTKWDAQALEDWRLGHKRYFMGKEIIKAIGRGGEKYIIANLKNKRVLADKLGEFKTYQEAQDALDKFAAENNLKEIGKGK